MEPVRELLLRILGVPSRNRLLLAGEPAMLRYIGELLSRWDVPAEPVR